MSAVLDPHPEWLDGVAHDLGSGARTGRHGMTAESAVRCALLKQCHRLGYEALAFHLEDSILFRAFARLPRSRFAPGKAALQSNISAITTSTWEGINRQLLRWLDKSLTQPTTARGLPFSGLKSQFPDEH